MKNSLGKGLITAWGIVLCIGCAELPKSVEDTGWQDLWGDRGGQVFARDYEMCATLVEQRRSLLASCLAQRGWAIGKTP